MNGGNDDFIELYNPTSTPVTLDSSWKLEARSNTAATYGTRWTGTDEVIPAHGHYLVTGESYADLPPGDGKLSSGITDATSIKLTQSGAVIDAVCYAFSLTTSTPFTTDATYTCEGTPADNSAHDNSGATDVDVSIERKGGNCTDTGNNAADFIVQSPATPMGS